MLLQPYLVLDYKDLSSIKNEKSLKKPCAKVKCDAGLRGYEGDLEEICGLCIASNDTLLQFENSMCEASDLLNDYYGSDLVEGYLSSDIRDLEKDDFSFHMDSGIQFVIKVLKEVARSYNANDGKDMGTSFLRGLPFMSWCNPTGFQIGRFDGCFKMIV